MKLKQCVNFFFELGHLRRIKHEGWRFVGVESPESVADHSLRAAQIGYLLAGLEEYGNPEEVCTMLVFHDIGETRIGDIHKIANKYVQAEEEAAVEEQLRPLKELGREILRYWQEVESRSTVAGNIAKDADFLEQALSAKELTERGYPDAFEWIKNVEQALQTRFAKKLLDELKQCKSSEWWRDLNGGG